MAGKYLYGVVKSNAGAGFFHEGRKFYAIPCKDIACIVSDSNGLDVDTADKSAVLRRLAKYQTAVESIMLKQGTVIPIKFGTVLKTDQEVEGALDAGYPEFSKRLETFDGKVEIDVTARWANLSGILKKIGEENGEIRRLRGEIAAMPFDKTVDERVKIGFMVKKALDRKRDEAADVILEELRKWSFDSRRQDCANDEAIFVCAFLVDKDKEGVFHDAMERLNRGFNEEVLFRCVSPLPPYAFAAMAVEKICRADVEKAREILGLGAQVTADKIKEAYHKKALESHPDKKSSCRDSSVGFEEIKRAYGVLKNCCAAEGYSLSAWGGRGANRGIHRGAHPKDGSDWPGDFFYVHEIKT